MTTRLEIGKLYRSPDYYLLVYPSSEIALEATTEPAPAATWPAGVVAAVATASAKAASAYWSEELGCTVRYSKPNEIFMIVDHEEKDRTDDFYHVVFGEIQGWIGHRDWMVIERIL